MCLPPDSYVLDRLEGDVAVLEGQGRTWDVPASALPPETQPGDTLRWDGAHFHRDIQETGDSGSPVQVIHSGRSLWSRRLNRVFP